MTLLVPVYSPIVTKAVTTSQWPGQPAGSARAPATWFAWPSPGAGARAAAASGNGTALRSCYDALVAATAAEYGITLATRDRRAAETYRSLDIDFELID